MPEDLVAVAAETQACFDGPLRNSREVAQLLMINTERTAEAFPRPRGWYQPVVPQPRLIQ